ncbi:MAG: hypothetical protein AAGA93_20955 [Actinomycetota bacterium]
MSSAETRLVRIAIILSVVLVAALAVLAVYSVIGQDGDDEVADPDQDDSTSEASGELGRAYPGPAVDIDDSRYPLTIGCVPATDPGSDFSVLITNRAETTVDYVVSLRLTVDDRTVLTSTEIRDLRPDEAREVIVGPGGSAAPVSECSVAAIQADRRIILGET